MKCEAIFANRALYSVAKMESYFASLKKELIYRKKYATIGEVKTDVFRYIELFYNR